MAATSTLKWAPVPIARPLMHDLDLAVKVLLPGVLPAPVLGDERDSAMRRFARRVQPADLQGPQACA